MAAKEMMPENEWTHFYPVYINKRKTLKEGRKVGLHDACDFPTEDDIHRVVRDELKLPCLAEPEKMYSRDYTLKGRVRVALWDASGNQLHPDIPNRMALWRHVASRIPLLKNRKGAGGGGKKGGKKGKKGKKNKKKKK